MENENSDKKLSFEILDQDWASDLQQGLDEYMMRLYDAIYEGTEEDYIQEGDAADNTESGIYFCGCSTCIVRENLAYATPRIIDGYLTGKVDIVRE
jgi:hypothetical protein